MKADRTLPEEESFAGDTQVASDMGDMMTGPTTVTPATNWRPPSPRPDASRGKATSMAAAHRAARPNAPSRTRSSIAKKGKEKGERISKAPAKVTRADRTVPVEEILRGTHKWQATQGICREQTRGVNRCRARRGYLWSA